MARKSKYNREYHLAWIQGLARRGATLKEIAEDLGVALSTIQKWCKDNEELAEALQKGRTEADIKVENSLYKRAMGCKLIKKKTIVGVGKENENKPARIEIYEEDVPPDTTACIFWLKNRNPQLWRDKQEQDITVSSFEKFMQTLPDNPAELDKQRQ